MNLLEHDAVGSSAAHQQTFLSSKSSNIAGPGFIGATYLASLQMDLRSVAGDGDVP